MLYKPFRQYIDAEPGVIAILCRHGSTCANDAAIPRVRGWLNNDLDERGKIEAQLLGYRIKKYDPKEIVSSDFARDSQTAQILANVLGITNIEVDYDSRTFDTGLFSDEPLAEVNPAIEQIYKNPWLTPPGGSESFNEFSARFTNFLEKKLKYATIKEFRPIIIVTHGKNIALAGTYINGGNAWESFMPKPAGYAVISVNSDRTLSIEIEQPDEPVIEDL